MPEFRMIIDNKEYFKLTLSLIFYSIYFSSLTDSFKYAEYFSLYINNIFNIDTSKLIENLYDFNKTVINKVSEVSENQKNDIKESILEKIDSAIEEINIENADLCNKDLKIFNDKDLNYNEVLEQLKNKNGEILDLDKFYNINKLADLIDFKKGKEYKSKINLGKFSFFKKMFSKYFIFLILIKKSNQQFQTNSHRNLSQFYP
jgi:phosphoribosyl-ATP pyrophosphohydrolase